MSALQEADKALDDFINKNVSCFTCAFFNPGLFGGECAGPELSMSYFEPTKESCCEQHVFSNTDLEKELQAIQDLCYNAWYIVEGFLYLSPPEAEI